MFKDDVTKLNWKEFEIAIVPYNFDSEHDSRIDHLHNDITPSLTLT